MGWEQVQRSESEFAHAQHAHGIVYQLLEVTDALIAVCLCPPRNYVCSEVKVFCDWDVLLVNSNSTLGDMFHGICSWQLDSPDGFCLEEQYADCPVSCSMVSIQAGKFHSISLCSASVYKTLWKSASIALPRMNAYLN